MYDPKNEVREFIGDGRDDAISKACSFYNVEKDELEILGFEPGAVYGLTTRAVIVAAPKGRTPTPAGRGERERPERGERGGRGRDRDRDRNRGGRHDSRDGRRDSGRGRGRERSSRSDSDREDSRSEESGEREGRTVREERSDEPSVGTVQGELGEIGDFVLGVMERMDLGPFEISEGEENELTAIEVKGPAAKALAGDEGRTVDALQLLANQVSVRINPDRQRVVIDIEGNAAAREEFLNKLADRVAERALQTGRPVALDPMNGRDRRMIHIALRDREDVATMSEGEGRYRQVVVVPEGSDEFEDAVAASDNSGS